MHPSCPPARLLSLCLALPPVAHQDTVLATPDGHLLRTTAKGGSPGSTGVWDWGLLPFTEQSHVLSGLLRAVLPLAEGATLELLPPGLCLCRPAQHPLGTRGDPGSGAWHTAEMCRGVTPAVAARASGKLVPVSNPPAREEQVIWSRYCSCSSQTVPASSPLQRR